MGKDRKRPAATTENVVSIGSDGTRTDGNPSNAKAVGRITDMEYGAQQALINQGQMGGGIPGGQGPNGNINPGAVAAQNIFAGTDRPAEFATEGADLGPGSPSFSLLEEDENALLAAMYAVMPNKLISELINNGSR